MTILVIANDLVILLPIINLNCMKYQHNLFGTHYSCTYTIIVFSWMLYREVVGSSKSNIMVLLSSMLTPRTLLL